MIFVTNFGSLKRYSNLRRGLVKIEFFSKLYGDYCFIDRTLLQNIIHISKCTFNKVGTISQVNKEEEEECNYLDFRFDRSSLQKIMDMRYDINVLLHTHSLFLLNRIVFMYFSHLKKYYLIFDYHMMLIEQYVYDFKTFYKYIFLLNREPKFKNMNINFEILEDRFPFTYYRYIKKNLVHLDRVIFLNFRKNRRRLLSNDNKGADSGKNVVDIKSLDLFNYLYKLCSIYSRSNRKQNKKVYRLINKQIPKFNISRVSSGLYYKVYYISKINSYVLIVDYQNRLDKIFAGKIYQITYMLSNRFVITLPLNRDKDKICVYNVFSLVNSYNEKDKVVYRKLIKQKTNKKEMVWLNRIYRVINDCMFDKNKLLNKLSIHD